MSYGISIRNNIGEMVEIESLPLVPHSCIVFENKMGVGTHHFKIAPATQGRSLIPSPCSATAQMEILSYEAGQINQQFINDTFALSIARHKYQLKIPGDTPNGGVITSFNVTDSGDVTVTVAVGYLGLAEIGYYPVYEIWEGVIR